MENRSDEFQTHHSWIHIRIARLVLNYFGFEIADFGNLKNALNFRNLAFDIRNGQICLNSQFSTLTALLR
ncbi:hypothetical protein BWI92_14390 [Flectobacillus sp. BAB-3569]|nr:hypothetical protein BWI92_14390 [Flectobacillus sp. BAB-3569]